MKSNQAKYRISTMCRTLGVSTSGYYAWLLRAPSARKQSDIALGDRVEAIHRRSRNTYGRPRIKAELKDDGISISNDRLARLMNERQLQGASRRKGIRTTVRDRDGRPAPDLVDRKFVADAPNKLSVADITYVPTYAGFLFLAIVLDAFSRRVVGWATSSNMKTQLVLDALNMAIYRRRPIDVVHHSDQGTQYTSIAFGSRCRKRISAHRWDRSGIATIMRCARASTLRWNASCSTSTVFARIRKPSSPSSTSLKDGTTFTAGIPRWAIDRRRSLSGKPPRDFPISNYPRKPGSFSRTLWFWQDH